MSKNFLKLSISNPTLWYKRSLPINSKEWKSLRQEILIRDNFTCNFCGIRLSKYLIVDHINGDATDNKSSNLRTNCPACDRIRHCGLAGIHQVLVAGKSKISQVEIVKKTVEYYLKNKEIPSPDKIDKKVIVTDLPPAFFIYNESYKGFFTSLMDFNYLKWIF